MSTRIWKYQRVSVLMGAVVVGLGAACWTAKSSAGEGTLVGPSQPTDSDTAPSQATADEGGTVVATPDNFQNVSWRYRFKNNHWWYWMPGDYWMIWHGGNWIAFDPNTYYNYYPGSSYNNYASPNYDSQNYAYPNYGSPNYSYPNYGSGYRGGYGYRSPRLGIWFGGRRGFGWGGRGGRGGRWR